jgi:hypothetical protein
MKNKKLKAESRIYYKNCNLCGKITKKDKWVVKNEKNDNIRLRPICDKCSFEFDYPEY